MKQEQITYTLILHQIRKKLKLSLMEYCVADSIYHLSNNPASEIKGWCFASKQTIARMLGTTARTIFEVLNKLEEKGLIERNKETRHLRTTSKWYNEVVMVKASKEYQETLHPVKKLHSKVSRNFIGKYDKTSHNNNKYKDIYNIGGIIKYPSYKEIEKQSKK